MPERAATATVVALAALVIVPLLPAALRAGSPAALLAIPVEPLLLLLVLVSVARDTSRTNGQAAAAGAGVAGVFAGVVVAGVVVAGLDAAFRSTIDRPFSLAEDGVALVNAFGVVEDAIGTVAAWAVAVALVAAITGAAVGLGRAALRVGRVTVAAEQRGRIALAAVSAAWIVCAVAGAQVAPGAPVAASGSIDAIVGATTRAVTGWADQRAFEAELATDALAERPPAEPLAALAGADVVIAFVESYGRVAVESSAFTAPIDRALADADAVLVRQGYAARSAFLTSPTFGGVSWLAHATLQSGVWVDSQRKHDHLLSGERLTLSSAFEEAGWRTIAVVPSNDRDWPEGRAFYGFDELVDARHLDYRGPAFGYARVPDQFTWQSLHALGLDDPSAPVMAEVDLVSSHSPWTPVPRLVPWAELGDGQVFADQPQLSESAAAVWADPAKVRAAYAESVAYSLDATFSYLDTHIPRDIVVVLVGDHQPSRIVSGPDASAEVPVTIIADDPAVLDRIASWGWSPGVRPDASAPVWRMDEFRDRFVTAFSG